MITVVDYHKGNLKSVERGLAAQGADVHVTDGAGTIARAEALVLPGVGAFGDAAAAMERLGQREAILEAIDRGAAFLGICLGMHLMFEAGQEGAGEDGRLPQGLGLIPGTVGRLPKRDAEGKAYKIPHVGWNTVELAKPEATRLFGSVGSEAPYFYFTHSFAAPDSAATIARTQHSAIFPSAVQASPRVFGVQFHPEKSSEAGARLLGNFVRIANER